MRGMSLFMMLVLLPIILLMLILAFYEGRKAYWDYRVNDMCEEDGGVQVFETVQISKEQFLAWGGVGDMPNIPFESEKRLDVPFFKRRQFDVIHSWAPRVTRTKTTFIRRNDNMILGIYVYYSRRGGDFPSWAHPSSLSCSNPKTQVEKHIIVIKE